MNMGRGIGETAYRKPRGDGNVRKMKRTVKIHK